MPTITTDGTRAGTSLDLEGASFEAIEWESDDRGRRRRRARVVLRDVEVVWTHGSSEERPRSIGPANAISRADDNMIGFPA